jgi:hypothetical protein
MPAAPKKLVRQDADVCWICGGRADSAEHVFKAREMKRVFGSEWTAQQSPLHHTEGKWHKVPGPKSKIIKYGKIICAACNNDRLSAADRAYDFLSDWFFQNQSTENLSIPFDAIFAGKSAEGLGLLHQYWTKALGCRIADSEGFRFPTAFPNPLHPAKAELSITICYSQPFQRFAKDDVSFDRCLLKGDLIGSHPSDQIHSPLKDLNCAIWWEHHGNFQTSYWWRIPPNPGFGEPLHESMPQYAITRCPLDKEGIDREMQAWLAGWCAYQREN